MGARSCRPTLRHSFDHRLYLLQNGIDHLAFLDVPTGSLTPIDTPYTSISGILTDGQRVVFRGGAPTLPGAIVSIDLASGAQTVIKRSMSLDIDGLSVCARVVGFPIKSRTAYRLFYAPNNRDFAARPGEKPAH